MLPEDPRHVGVQDALDVALALLEGGGAADGIRHVGGVEAEVMGRLRLCPVHQTLEGGRGQGRDNNERTRM